MRKEAETEVAAAVITEKPCTELGAGSCLTAKPAVEHLKKRHLKAGTRKDGGR